ncbi:MAG: hypothetical protein CVT88_09365 [Candidatus Altiarchaeales archaeon HGW-Altiarchaeales-1]|nr:MAG: hypothetical protein CVT88_09365 [Candidatus Altiarchaeales archaeon HGW-Altiarchaeales-1]
MTTIFLHPPGIYDFRKRPVFIGAMSEAVPSTPVFEMYPMGFVSMAHYLERHGHKARIVNIALKMLNSEKFDVEKFIKKLDAEAFCIDLHWIAHLHGAIEIAKICKKFHPNTPVIFGGFTSTYYSDEILTKFPFIDYVLKGDSCEYPLLKLIENLNKTDKEDIPNLSWRKNNMNKSNPITNVPETISFVIDPKFMLKLIIRDMDIDANLPYRSWLTEIFEKIKKEKFDLPVVFELFSPLTEEFAESLKCTFAHYNLEMSPEDASDNVRFCTGKNYTNADVEKSIEIALNNDCDKFDLFFMLGLGRQSKESIYGTVDYIDSIIGKFKNFGEHKVYPFISPYAPTLDPGSIAFEEPAKYGYVVLHRTLEEHYNAFDKLSWKDFFNYRTENLSPDDIIALTYDTAVKLAHIKRKHNMVNDEYVENMEKQVEISRNVMKKVAQISTMNLKEKCLKTPLKLSFCCHVNFTILKVKTP